MVRLSQSAEEDSMEQEKGGRSIYARITEQIAAAITAGAPTFEMPWHRRGPAVGRPENISSGQKYRGVNVIALWVAAQLGQYSSGYWASYRQWSLAGAQVRKGERGTPIVFYKRIERQASAGDEDEGRTQLVARTSYVFNAAQVDGWTAPAIKRPNLVKRIGGAELFVQSTGADVRENRPMAQYVPSQDYIEMPAREAFIGSSTSSATDTYYSTLFHELIHWTGHERRLDRKLVSRFGDEAYAIEELVAELGAAFLCADFGMGNIPRPDHAAYIDGWLRVLGHDIRAIFTAASKANIASDYLHALSAAALERLQALP